MIKLLLNKKIEVKKHFEVNKHFEIKKKEYKIININLIINHPHGIFSIFSLALMSMMEHSLYNNNIMSFKITDTFNIFDLITQKNNCIYTNYTPKNIYNDFLNITNIKSKNFLLGKNILKKIKLSDELMNLVNLNISKYNINNKTLGIHIRLTDMNINHHSILSINTYIDKIRKIIKENQISNIFLASDNDESIDIIIKHFANENLSINYIPNLIRSLKQETSQDFTIQQYNYLYNTDQEIKKNFITDSFLDMLCLSKCGYLIHRTSNVANFAILYSDSIEHIYKLD